MKSLKHLAIIAGLGLANVLPAQGDGLGDLTHALNTLQGSGEISAELATSSVRIRGEGKDEKITKGEVTVWLEDTVHGLQVLYSDDILTKMDDEAVLRMENEDAATTTLNAVDRINASELNAMLSASSSILRTISMAEFLDEKQEQLKDETVRVLRFKLPIEQILRDKKTRSYVKKFLAHYYIWIDDKGIPLQSRMQYTGKGRAYIFFNMKSSGEEQTQYQVVNNRLVMVHSHQKNTNDTTFGLFQYQETKTLQPQTQQKNTN
jgi:menaquinone-dependent protoporphyrinogen IX oxidase